MIEFGKSLREAREAKGLTISELASLTHMMASSIEDLEAEDFSHIPAPIYGRGFVKLYCEAVGLEPKTYIGEFMSIYNGEREPIIHERDTAESASTATQQEPSVPATQEPPKIAEVSGIEPEPKPIVDLFSLAAEAAVPMTTPPSPPQQTEMPRFVPPGHTQEIRNQRMRRPSPRIPWRLTVLILIATATAIVIAYSLRMLYRATTTSSPVKMQESTHEKSATPRKEAPKPATAARTPAKKPPRQPQAIPSLYID